MRRPATIAETIHVETDVHASDHDMWVATLNDDPSQADDCPEPILEAILGRLDSAAVDAVADADGYWMYHAGRSEQLRRQCRLDTAASYSNNVTGLVAAIDAAGVTVDVQAALALIAADGRSYVARLASRPCAEMLRRLARRDAITADAAEMIVDACDVRTAVTFADTALIDVSGAVRRLEGCDPVVITGAAVEATRPETIVALLVAHYDNLLSVPDHWLAVALDEATAAKIAAKARPVQLVRAAAADAPMFDHEHVRATTAERLAGCPSALSAVDGDGTINDTVVKIAGGLAAQLSGAELTELHRRHPEQAAAMRRIAARWIAAECRDAGEVTLAVELAETIPVVDAVGAAQLTSSRRSRQAS